MFIGKPLFTGMVTVELMWERFLDSFVPKPYGSPLVDKDLTAVIKTFERPEALKRLVKSIRRFYPFMQIVVVDDSQVPSHLEGVRTIVMPYDSGVSTGRNRALAAVETKYMLLLDDDFVFYRKTDLEPAMKMMQMQQEIDIMGGMVVNLPLFTVTDYSRSGLHKTSASAVKEVGSTIGGLPVYDKVPNFYIGRTERLKRVGWDERIKRLDHADFFTRAKGVLTTVFNPHFKVLHAQTPYDKSYMEKRNDDAADRRLLYEKYYG